MIGYKFVWGDEFDGDKLDTSKWTLRADMSGRSDLALCGEENPDAMRVEDGLLKLNVIENADVNEKKYSTCYSVTTFNKMRFRYGYLLISARVSYMQGGDMLDKSQKKQPYVFSVNLTDRGLSCNTEIFLI